ncbi:hypothetical protein G3576_02625 [Roseomonas stagni]|uniref:Uncharacterized protein n=1 Tax=Falsiroseomonas algicola TaxID=2716930 RepID=A0A6M1LFH7_9PROT|nr:hypothetical protein [Falsiroseomonas algicola]NGM18892.1 hypothetical protein [Falsiroseomonas algicola]
MHHTPTPGAKPDLLDGLRDLVVAIAGVVMAFLILAEAKWFGLPGPVAQVIALALLAIIPAMIMIALPLKVLKLGCRRDALLPFAIVHAVAIAVSVPALLGPGLPTVLMTFMPAIGALLLVALNAALALSVWWPAFLVARITGRRRPALLLAAALLAALSIPPGLASRLVAEREAVALRAEDVAGRVEGAAPRRLEIAVASVAERGAPQPFLDARCDALCEGLLRSGQVDRLRITWQAPDAPPRSAIYAAAAPETCRAGRPCVATIEEADWAPSPRVSVTETTLPGPRAGDRRGSRLMTRFEVTLPDEGGDHLAARSTMLRASVVTIPALVDYNWPDHQTAVVGVSRIHRLMNPTGVRDILLNTLGYDVPPDERPS